MEFVTRPILRVQNRCRRPGLTHCYNYRGNATTVSPACLAAPMPTRYSCAMRRILVIFVLCASSAAVPAQPGGQQAHADRLQLERDQRRSELREVLRLPRTVVPDTTTAQADVPPPVHHLTPQGRAELREQLRQDKSGTRRPTP